MDLSVNLVDVAQAVIIGEHLFLQVVIRVILLVLQILLSPLLQQLLVLGLLFSTHNDLGHYLSLFLFLFFNPLHGLHLHLVLFFGIVKPIITLLFVQVFNCIWILLHY